MNAIKYKFPHPDKIVSFRRMAPIHTTLSEALDTSTSNPSRMDARAQGGRANSQRSRRSTLVRTPRQTFSESTRRTQQPLLSRSLSVAAARTALYGSNGTYQSTRPKSTRKPPAMSCAYLSGAGRPRTNTQPVSVIQQREDSRSDNVNLSVGSNLKDDKVPRSSRDRHIRAIRLGRHSSQNLRWDYHEGRPSVQTSRHETCERTEGMEEYISDTSSESDMRTRESDRRRERDRNRRTATAVESIEQLAQATAGSSTRPTGNVDANLWTDTVTPLTRDIMSPTAQLLYNPFADFPSQHTQGHAAAQPSKNTRRGRRTSPNVPAAKSILKPSRTPDDQDPPSVRFGIGTRKREDGGPDLYKQHADKHAKTVYVPEFSSSESSISDLASRVASRYTPPVQLAPFSSLQSPSTHPNHPTEGPSSDVCRRCNHNPRSTYTQGCCQPCWALFDYERDRDDEEWDKLREELRGLER